MTFNEFRQLAENPPRKDEPTIFKVAVYDIDTFEMDQECENDDKESPGQREYYPEFPLYCHHEVLSPTLHDAEAVMMRLFRDVPNAYCAVITELPFGDDIRSDYISVRVYDNTGGFIDSSKCSSYFTEERDDYRHFRGRSPEEIRFEKGDIVEVFCGSSVCLAVIVGLPLSVECCYSLATRMCGNKRDREMTQQQWEDFCFNRGYPLDDTDDCYTVVDGPGYIHHEHIPSYCVFKPHFPLPKHIEEKLHRDYQATIEEIGPTSEPS